MNFAKTKLEQRQEFKLVSEQAPQEQKEIIEELVLIEKHKHIRHHIFPSGEMHELVDGRWVKVKRP